MAGDQGVLVGAGAVHPVQRARHAQPGLVESDHLRGGEPATYDGEELLQPARGAGGEGSDGAGRQRGAEQLSEGPGGALFGQELPDVEVDHDRGDACSVLDRGVYPRWCAAAGAVPA